MSVFVVVLDSELTSLLVSYTKMPRDKSRRGSFLRSLLIDELTKQVFDTLKHHPWKMDIHGVTSIARLFNSIPMQFREGVTKKGSSTLRNTLLPTSRNAAVSITT